MSELNSFKSNISKFDYQPDFPNEDLTDNNTDMLKYVLVRESGLDTYAQMLARDQRSIYDIANRALGSLNIRTQIGPKSLHAFSHGFAGFEAMTDMVHPNDKLAYPTDVAIERMSNDIIDSRPSDDIEFENMVRSDDEDELPDGMTTDGVRARYIKHGEDTVDLPPVLANFLVGQHKSEIAKNDRNRRDAPAKLARHYMKVMQTYPNMVDVMTEIGEARSESMPELYSRLAGMSIAHSLQVRD